MYAWRVWRALDHHQCRSLYDSCAVSCMIRNELTSESSRNSGMRICLSRNPLQIWHLMICKLYFFPMDVAILMNVSIDGGHSLSIIIPLQRSTSLPSTYCTSTIELQWQCNHHPDHLISKVFPIYRSNIVHRHIQYIYSSVHANRCRRQINEGSVRDADAPGA